MTAPAGGSPPRPGCLGSGAVGACSSPPIGRHIEPHRGPLARRFAVILIGRRRVRHLPGAERAIPRTIRPISPGSRHTPRSDLTHEGRSRPANRSGQQFSPPLRGFLAQQNCRPPRSSTAFRPSGSRPALPGPPECVIARGGPSQNLQRSDARARGIRHHRQRRQDHPLQRRRPDQHLRQLSAQRRQR